MFEHCADHWTNPDSHWTIDPLCTICDEPEDRYQHREPKEHDFVPVEKPWIFGENAYRRNDCEFSVPNENMNEYNTEEYIRCTCPCHWRGYFVNVYDADRAYGGPEEGGWYYDTGEPVSSMRFETYNEAVAFKESIRHRFPRTGKRGNYHGGEDYDIVIEDKFAEPFPEETPRYE